MARWTKIDRRLQNDAKYRALSMEGQWVFLTIMTHPSQTALGAMRGSIEGLSIETGKSFDTVSKGFHEAIEREMLEYDPSAAYICLPNFMKHNYPASGKVILSWAKCLDYIPECALKSLLLQRVTAFVKTLPKGFQKSFDTVSLDFSSKVPQEQEQEQEQCSSSASQAKKRFSSENLVAEDADASKSPKPSRDNSEPICVACKGAGYLEGTPSQPCPECSGAGRLADGESRDPEEIWEASGVDGDAPAAPGYEPKAADAEDPSTDARSVGLFSTESASEENGAPIEGTAIIARWNALAKPRGLPTIARWTKASAKKYQLRTSKKEFPDFWEILTREIPLLSEFDRGWIKWKWLLNSEDKFARFADGEFRERDKPKKEADDPFGAHI